MADTAMIVTRVIGSIVYGGMLLVNMTAQAQSTSAPIMGLQAVKEPLPWFDAARNYPEYDGKTKRARHNAVAAVTSLRRPPMAAPVSLKLSRFLYPAEDGHLDAVVRFDMPLQQVPEGQLQVELRDGEGKVLSEALIRAIPGPQLFFSYKLTEQLIGASGSLHVSWIQNAQTLGEAAADFQVARPNKPDQSGRVRLQISNTVGAELSVPFTVGVPFPRGALASTDNLRLVRADGREIPMQVHETARWSRFGSIKWVLCDFTTALDGVALEVFLEYGPEVTRAERSSINVTPGADGLLLVEAGRVRLDNSGLNFDPSGGGDFRNILKSDALTGAFVQHVNDTDFTGWGHAWMSSSGTEFTMPAGMQFEVEEIGSEKAVLRVADWYENAESGERFCKFVTRYVIYRDSPVVRIIHSWIFTGDSNRDRIRNMGWRFPLNDMKPRGFLSGFGTDAEWLDGYYLRQEDAGKYTLFDRSEPKRHPVFNLDTDEPARPIKEKLSGERAAGVIAAHGNGVQLFIGVKDFWQNFPRSLEQKDDELTFYEWPLYGRDHQHPISGDNMQDVWRLWFAHEGETLNLGIPQQLTEGALYRGHSGPEPRMLYARPDSVNAQGIAKTAEMLIYLASEAEDEVKALRLLQGLQDDSLRGVVDPEWMAASGAFHEIAPQRPQRYAEDEEVYDENVRSAFRDIERMGIYGKWIYGDLLTVPDLEQQTTTLNRGRATSWGYPFSWIPFVRSGDLDFFRFAQAAARYLTDVPFCHYASEELSDYFKNLPKLQIWDKQRMFRRVGWWHSTHFIPWVGYWGPTARMVNDGAEWLWPAWYIAGDHRAREVAMIWAAQTKIEEAITSDGELIGCGPITTGYNRGRWSINLQKQYQDMWEATWDPWFLAGTQALADLQLWEYSENDHLPHIWNTGPSDYLRYSGNPAYRELYLKYAGNVGDWQYTGWGNASSVIIPPAAFIYGMTGEDYYLRRLAGIAELQRWAVFAGDEPAYAKGHYITGGTYQNTMQTSWMQKWFPLLLGAFEQAGRVPERFIPLSYVQSLGSDTRIAVRKEAGEELLLRVAGQHIITGPNNDEVKEGDAAEVILAAEAPAGIYLLDLGKRSVRLPLSPPDTPEVLIFAANEDIPAASEFGQYWFMVPVEVQSFQLEVDNARYVNTEWLRQFIVWNPDGDAAWTFRQLKGEYDPQQKNIIADIQVTPEQAGRLWRVTLPRRGGVRFRLDPQIPPQLAHDPWRWFEPRTPEPGE